MHVDLVLVLASAGVGYLVGLTGAGGGALMTPMLVFFFGVSPGAAISSDLVAALVMRPFGGAVHLRRGTVHLAVVGWLVLGSVPTAFCGALLLRAFGVGPSGETVIEAVLGSALLLGASAMVVRAWLRRGDRPGPPAPGTGSLPVRPLATVAIGAFGGLLVGLTSVGSGSLMIVLLLFCYPTLAASELVGTDLVQAVPLTASAALGQLLFGHVELSVTASLVIGSVPAVLVGSLLSSRAPDRLLRPAVAGVLLVSGLKCVGVTTPVLAWTTGALVVLGAGWLVARRRRSGPVPGGPHAGISASGAPGSAVPGSGAPASGGPGSGAPASGGPGSGAPGSADPASGGPGADPQPGQPSSGRNTIPVRGFGVK